MGAMSQLAMERDEEISSLNCAYHEAYHDLMELHRTLPMHRTHEQNMALLAAESKCADAKWQYEKSMRIFL